MPTLVCVPIMVDDAPSALREAQLARDAGADIIELRLDRFYDGLPTGDAARAIERLIGESPLPVIVTCRPTSEGGEFEGDDESRLELMERLAAIETKNGHHPPAFIDLEQATIERLPGSKERLARSFSIDSAATPDGASRLILSNHDFAGRPAGLFKTIAAMRAVPEARVLKIAWRARSIRDNTEVFDLLREKDRPTIALAMGPFGLLSRVLAPRFGAFLTFASLRDASATAPGQPTVRELLDLYRFRAIGAATRLYGVIGWPLEHSRSPHIHNAGFESVSWDGVYAPLPVAEGWEPFKASVLVLLDDRSLDFRGASVTIPHKEHLVRLAREDRSRAWHVDPLAEAIGAANTLTVRDDGSCHVSNTDAPAAAAALRSGLGRDLAGARVLILGAGGVARAAAAGLLDAGASVVVAARTRDRAGKLVADLSRRAEWAGRLAALDIPAAAAGSFDAIVNGTPVGMAGGPDPAGLPLDLAAILPGSHPAVFDTVYNPLMTPLLLAARDRGLGVITGDRMFIDQAARQFELWTGRPAPRARMERVLRETLEGREA